MQYGNNAFLTRIYLEEKGMISMNSKNPVTAEDVELALRRWKGTVSFFENVSEPHLVEIAIFEMEAAQRQYIYLLERYRKNA